MEEIKNDKSESETENKSDVPLTKGRGRPRKEPKEKRDLRQRSEAQKLAFEKARLKRHEDIQLKKVYGLSNT